MSANTNSFKYIDNHYRGTTYDIIIYYTCRAVVEFHGLLVLSIFPPFFLLKESVFPP